MSGTDDQPRASLGEVMAEVRAIGARLDDTRADMGNRLEEIRTDAREARDAAARLTERMGAQDLPAQLTELRGEMKAGFVEARSDLVNAMTNITSETRNGHADHERRIKELEDFRSKLIGGSSLVGWVSRHAPWLLTVLLAVAAALGWKDKLP